MRRAVLFVGLAVGGGIGGCLVAPQGLARDIAQAAVAGMIAVLAIAGGALLYEARRHHQLATGLARLAYHGTLAGEPVEFVPGLTSPVVAGLRTPRIFCGEDLVARLDAEEVQAVLLHERFHLIDMAPLRLVAIAALSRVLGRPGRRRAWLERERARIEIAADGYAMAVGVSRPVIASALLKLSARREPAFAPGFSTAADLRIRVLLGEPPGLVLGPRLSDPVGVAAVVLIACLVAYIS